MIGISGSNSAIARRLAKLLPAGEEIIAADIPHLQFDCGRYFLCDGFLAGANAEDISQADFAESMNRNFLEIVTFCDRLFRENKAARVCIMGSNSAYQGSYDIAYAGSKAALHLYIETKRLTFAGQQLIGIAPNIIWDSGMTQRRKDLQSVAHLGERRRRGRWLEAVEVARLAHFALYVDEGALCNTVIRIHGGTW